MTESEISVERHLPRWWYWTKLRIVTFNCEIFELMSSWPRHIQQPCRMVMVGTQEQVTQCLEGNSTTRESRLEFFACYRAIMININCTKKITGTVAARIAALTS